MSDNTRSYAVVWQKNAGPVTPGQLQLLTDAIRLRGGARSRPVEHALPYQALSSVRLARHPDERIQGRPSLFSRCARSSSSWSRRSAASASSPSSPT